MNSILDQMTSIARMQTGRIPGLYRVRGQRGRWWVEGTDSNCVWLEAEPGTHYRTQREAYNAARDMGPLA